MSLRRFNLFSSRAAITPDRDDTRSTGRRTIDAPCPWELQQQLGAHVLDISGPIYVSLFNLSYTDITSERDHSRIMVEFQEHQHITLRKPQHHHTPRS